MMKRIGAFLNGRLEARGYVRMTPQELMDWARAKAERPVEVQAEKRKTRFARDTGPMYFLGQQICKQMQLSGWDAKIVECFRSPQRQFDLFAKGRSQPGPKVTNASAFQSPHQYFEAVDIAHPTKGWDVPEDYWTALAACVRVVAEKYRVELEHGHTWEFRDSAHIEIADWRAFAGEVGQKRPTYDQLKKRFHDVLGDV